MKFIVSWTSRPATYRATIARFLKGGGAPPKGVTMLGRWHGMSGGGFAVVESTDAKAMYAWVAEWAEFLELTTTPAMDDAEAGEVLAKVHG